MRKSLLLQASLCLLISLPSFAQQKTEVETKKKPHGTLFINWGYHRDAYTKSTIHFKDNSTPNSPHYDFTLVDAKAHDRLDTKHFLNTAPTVPQYMLTMGYFFNDKRDLGVEVCWNHLKYIVTDNQMLHLKGTIDEKYFDQDTLVGPGFIHYEHTNGNNYLILSLIKRFQMLSSRDQQHKLSTNFRLGFGCLIPKTESSITINNVQYHNDGPFRISGWVIGVGAAVRYDLFKYFFLEPSVKGSFVDYTDVKLYKHGRADQRFYSVQYILSIGFNYPLGT